MSTSLSAKRTSIPLIPLPPLLFLPKEILEEIVSVLSDPTDLLSLALACSSLTAFIIPRHTEYRIIRVRTLNPTLFAHLARRADLARNVREIHVCEKNNFTGGDRVPRKLVAMERDMEVDYDNDMGAYMYGGEGDGAAEERRVANVCKALRHMKYLRVFTWSWNVRGQGMGIGAMGRPTLLPRHEDAILAQIVNKPTLQHFGISGAFGTHAPGLSLDKNNMLYPIWQLNKLTSLCLLGDAWVKNTNALLLCLMLARSPNLQYLELPLDCPALPSLHLPSLKYLKLFLQSGATPAIDAACVLFLEKHSTIEELSWYPIGAIGADAGMPALKEGMLPRLRRLRGSLGVIEALAMGSGSVQRGAESIPVSLSTLMIKEAGSDGAHNNPETSDNVSAVSSGPASPIRTRFDPFSYSPPPQSPLSLCAPPSTPTYPSVVVPRRQSFGAVDNFDEREERFRMPDAAYGSNIPYGSSDCSWSSSLPTPLIYRPMESLDIRSLTPSRLLELYTCSSCLYHSSSGSYPSSSSSFHLGCSSPPSFSRFHLRNLALYILPTKAELVKMSEVFPNIEWLSLPSPPVYSQPLDSSSTTNLKGDIADEEVERPLTLRDVLEVLPLFTHLKIFRGPLLWSLVVLNSPSSSTIGSAKKLSKEQAKQEMHQVIMQLVASCPNLKEVDHCDFYERRFGFKRVVVERVLVKVPNGDVTGEELDTEEEMEVVGYCVKRPRMRECFDVLDGAFS